MSQKRQKVGRVLPMTTGVSYDKIELSEGEGAFRKQKIPSPLTQFFIARSEYDEIYFIKEVFYAKRGTNLGKEQSHP